MYVIYEKPFEEILTDVSSVGKEFSEESLRKLLVFQWLAVIAVPRCELPLDDFSLVVDDQMQFEPEANPSITVFYTKIGADVNYDVNGDGLVTIADVTKLVNVILGKE